MPDKSPFQRHRIVDWSFHYGSVFYCMVHYVMNGLMLALTYLREQVFTWEYTIDRREI